MNFVIWGLGPTPIQIPLQVHFTWPIATRQTNQNLPPNSKSPHQLNPIYSLWKISCTNPRKHPFPSHTRKLKKNRNSSRTYHLSLFFTIHLLCTLSFLYQPTSLPFSHYIYTPVWAEQLVFLWFLSPFSLNCCFFFCPFEKIQRNYEELWALYGIG